MENITSYLAQTKITSSSGAAYILSREILTNILCAAHNAKLEESGRGIPWEDVYVTGVLAVYSDVIVTHASRFSSARQHYRQPDYLLPSLGMLKENVRVYRADDRKENSLDSDDVITRTDDKYGMVKHATNYYHSIWKCVKLLSFRGGYLTKVLWNKKYNC